MKLYIFVWSVATDTRIATLVFPSTLTDLRLSGDTHSLPLSRTMSSPHETKVSFFAVPTEIEIVDDCLYRISDHTLLSCLCFPKGGSITVKEGAEHLADNAFAEREDLEAVILPEGVRTIGEGGFSGCLSLSSLSLPSTLEYVGDRCFMSTSLKELKFPEGMKEIGGDLMGGSFITKVSLPASLEKIGPKALFNYRTVDVKLSPMNPHYRLDGNLLIDTRTKKLHTVVNGEKLKKVAIPETVEIIGENAFTYCTKLTKLIIPDNVREIESNAFFSCGVLCEITVGSGVEKMERGAIMYCGDAYAAKHELTLYVQAGSVAEAYAKENGIAYEIK